MFPQRERERERGERERELRERERERRDLSVENVGKAAQEDAAAPSQLQDYLNKHPKKWLLVQEEDLGRNHKNAYLIAAPEQIDNLLCNKWG